MPKKPNLEAESIAEFDLKHRVTGAAVLLFLGALVLPWLLGPPSEASKIDVTQQLPIISEVEVANIVSAENSYDSDAMANEIEETVYISKITPLDAKGNSDLVKAAKEAAASTSLRQQQQDDSGALAEIVKQENQALEKLAAEKTSVDNVSANTTDKEAPTQKPVAAISDPLPAPTAQDLQNIQTAELKSQLLKKVAEEQGAAKKTTIDVGWIVQVGLFTDKSRAIALISELSNKGFTASSSVVDTNQGKKTGTRVWLGPFGKRVAAINQQKMLKAKAGKEGFIRVYP
jgi:cell division septation protein DedD